MADTIDVPDGFVVATWCGPAPVVIPTTRTLLNPGDTHLVGASEAEESMHWRPTRRAKTPTDQAAAIPADEGKEAPE